MSATGLGSAVKMRELFSRRDNKRENRENTHTERKRDLNKAQQETAQTTLVDDLDFLQSGDAVLSIYTNKLIYCSCPHCLKSYIHLFYIIVYVIKNLMKTYLQVNEL